MSRPSAEDIAAELGLTPLGFEGGYYRETHRSAYASAIFYMLTPDTRSLMHRLRADEVYHFYLGDPVDLLTVHPDGRAEEVRLGAELLAGHRVQQVVPAGVWQGSALVPGGRFALMGTTMAPGFDLEGFELGRRRALVEAFPALADRLRPLTPEVLETERLELAAATRDLLYAELRGTPALLAGLAASSAAGWAPSKEGELRARIARLEADPASRAWGGWYVVRRGDRALLGAARFEGPPDDAGEARLTLALTPDVAEETTRALVARAFEAAEARRVRCGDRVFEREPR